MMNGIYMQHATIGGCDEDGEYELQHIAIPVPALRGVDIEGDHEGAVRELVEAIDAYISAYKCEDDEAISGALSDIITIRNLYFKLVEDAK